MTGDAPARLAETIHRLLRDEGATVSVAESLTGGLLGAALTDPAGASATFRGGVLAYASDLKVALLGVDPVLLERHGAVHPEVALAMAAGVRERLATTYGLATTGVAGPDPQDGQPPGTVFVAVAGPRDLAVVAAHRFDGLDRAAVRAASVAAALDLLGAALADRAAENRNTGV